MENSSIAGFRTRLRELGRKKPVTVEADVEFPRGPAPALFAIPGLIALAISVLSVVVVVTRIHEISDRAVRVQATVLGGVRNLNTDLTDLDIRYEFNGVAHRQHIRKQAPTVVPATLTVVVDPKGPERIWLPGDLPARALDGPAPFTAFVGLGAGLNLLGVARKLRRRRRRLGLHEPTETKRCLVLAKAVATVEQVPDEFVITGVRPSRAFNVALSIIAVVLIGFGIVWGTSSVRGALFAAVWMAGIVGSGFALRRANKRCIVVSNSGVVVQGFRDEREFLWSDIVSASVVRTQPWRYAFRHRRESRGHLFELVRVEACMMTTSGMRVPTRLATRVCSWQTSALEPRPPDAAERLVVAWAQQRRSEQFHRERELGRTARW